MRFTMACIAASTVMFTGCQQASQKKEPNTSRTVVSQNTSNNERRGVNQWGHIISGSIDRDAGYPPECTFQVLLPQFHNSGVEPPAGGLEETVLASCRMGRAEGARLRINGFDLDHAEEGELYINGNGPIRLFADFPQMGPDKQEYTTPWVDFDSSWLATDRRNEFLFRHVQTAGYDVYKIELEFDFNMPRIPFANVLVRAIDANGGVTGYGVTHTNGYYEIVVPNGWSGTVEPVAVCEYNDGKGPYCEQNIDCDNGVFCDGVETCIENNCLPGEDPCPEGKTCNDETDSCVGHPYCVGDDDCDNRIFCDGVERCIEGVCYTGLPACPPEEICNEEDRTCTVPPDVCTADSDCDDGVFCNGAERCNTTTGDCIAGTNPCNPDEICQESTQSCQAGMWVAPLGIPVPEFGIEETAPPYDETNSLHYYVDNTHPAATNSDNPNGTPDKPRTTIPMGLPAGANVVVLGGPYNYTSMQNKLYISGDGTPTAPIFIRGLGSTQRPIFEKNVFVTGDYIIFEHLKFNNNGFELRSVGGPMDHIAVRFCEMEGDGSERGGGTNSVVGNPHHVSHIVFYNNHVHHNGDDSNETAADRGRHGFLVTYNTSDVWVVDNIVHDNNADSIQVNYHGSVSGKIPATRVYIGRNVMYSDRENAIDIKVALDVIVSENTIYGYQPSLTSEGAAIVIHKGQVSGSYVKPINVWVLNNTIYDSTFGISVTQGSDVYAINNLIKNIYHTDSDHNWNSIYGQGMGMHVRNSGPVYALHNTFIGCDTAVSTNATMRVERNIMSHLNNDNSLHVNVEGSNASADWNLYYQPDRSANIRWGGSTKDFNTFRATSNHESNGNEGNPMFVHLDGDYRLQSGSPGIDAGNGLHFAFNQFQTLYGLDIVKDMERTDRLKGVAVDMGCYEN